MKWRAAVKIQDDTGEMPLFGFINYTGMDQRWEELLEEHPEGCAEGHNGNWYLVEHDDGCE